MLLPSLASVSFTTSESWGLRLRLYELKAYGTYVDYPALTGRVLSTRVDAKYRYREVTVALASSHSSLGGRHREGAQKKKTIWECLVFIRPQH